MECERPSGLALTGHDDHFDWIELMAQSPSGAIVERAWVRIGDHGAIGAWPEMLYRTYAGTAGRRISDYVRARTGLLLDIAFVNAFGRPRRRAVSDATHVRVQKRYRKEDGSYENTEYCFPEDLPRLQECVQEAFEYTVLTERKDLDETVPIQCNRLPHPKSPLRAGRALLRIVSMGAGHSKVSHVTATRPPPRLAL